MDDYSDSRWMPPSPHREAIIWTLHQGRAHIEERGHDLPPLFVYEDGGAMELHLMRLVDDKLIAVADAALPETSTKHIDVCGTIDELKQLWAKQPELADRAPEQLLELLEHAMKMLRRIQQRLAAYREFSDAIAARAAEMDALQPPAHGRSVSFEEEIAGIIRAGGAAVREHLQELFDAAEAIRKIAGDSEQVLYRYRDLAIEIGALYEGIRGAREWQAPQGG